MTNFVRNHGRHTMNRRVFLQSLAATVAGVSAAPAVAQQALVKPSAATSLKLAAQQSNKVLGMYTVQYQLLHDPQATAMIAEGFSLIADGNDLKFSDRLRHRLTRLISASEIQLLTGHNNITNYSAATASFGGMGFRSGSTRM